MKNKIINYILTGLISIGIGILIGFILDKPKNTVEFLPSETVYVDTCLESRILCTLSTTDSLNIYYEIKRGKMKSTKDRPKIEDVKVVDTIKVNTPVLQRTYTKQLNNGLVEVNDTLIVKGEILDWKRSYQVDTLQLTREVIRNTTAVIEEGKDDTQTVRYIPTESSSLYIGPSAGLLYDGETLPFIGLNLQGKQGSVYLQANPKTLKEWQIGLNTRLIRIKK